MEKRVVISTSAELVSVAPETIVYIESDGSYSIMTLVDRSRFTFSFNLQHFGQLLVDQLKTDATMFIRIGKSVIINRNFLQRINPAKQQLMLACGDMLQEKFTLSASKDALKQVKQYIESEI